MKTIRCCLFRQTMKKFIKRRLNSFKTQTRTLSENVSLNQTKIILNRKNAIIHNKSRKLFLTERQDKQMIIEASRFRVARSLTASPLARRYSTSWNENKNLLPLQANHQDIFWKANELIQDMLFKTLRIAWRIHSWVSYTRIRQHVWDNFWQIFSWARTLRWTRQNNSEQNGNNNS